MNEQWSADQVKATPKIARGVSQNSIMEVTTTNSILMAANNSNKNTIISQKLKPSPTVHGMSNQSPNQTLENTDTS